MLHSILVPVMILIPITACYSVQISATLGEYIQSYSSEDPDLRPTSFEDTFPIRTVVIR
jgi:hypothetical protein